MIGAICMIISGFLCYLNGKKTVTAGNDKGKILEYIGLAICGIGVVLLLILFIVIGM